MGTDMDSHTRMDTDRDEGSIQEAGQACPFAGGSALSANRNPIASPVETHIDFSLWRLSGAPASERKGLFLVRLQWVYPALT